MLSEADAFACVYRALHRTSSINALPAIRPSGDGSGDEGPTTCRQEPSKKDIGSWVPVADSWQLDRPLPVGKARSRFYENFDYKNKSSPG